MEHRLQAGQACLIPGQGEQVEMQLNGGYDTEQISDKHRCIRTHHYQQVYAWIKWAIGHACP